MDAMLFHTFQDNELGGDAHITEAFFESLQMINFTPLFEPGQSKSTQLGTTILPYNLKVKYGMLDANILAMSR